MPSYCLDAKLQGGIGGIPKWDPRSRLEIFVLFIPDIDPDPNPMASEGAVTVDNPVGSGQDLMEVPPTDG